MTDKLIISELLTLPEALKKEVLHYIRFIKKERATEQEKSGSRIFGRAKGKYKIAPDFDAPLEDFNDYM